MRISLPSKKYPNRFAFVDDRDYHLISHFHWNPYVDYNDIFYATASIYKNPDGSIVKAKKEAHPDAKYTTIQMHRLIWEAYNSPVVQLDHTDHNGLNNQMSNLRDGSGSKNQMNQRKPHTYKGRPPTSFFKGVSRCEGVKKWRSQIMKDGKQIHLGYFINEIEAAFAYDMRAVLLFEENAQLNFPKLRPSYEFSMNHLKKEEMIAI